MIAIIDYGVGNLFSLKSSLAAIGREAVVTGDRAVLRAASHVILPGVGAFGDAAARLRAAGMAEACLLYTSSASAPALVRRPRSCGKSPTPSRPPPRISGISPL